MDTVEFRLTLSCGHSYLTPGRDVIGQGVHGKIGPIMDGTYSCPACSSSMEVVIAERLVNGRSPVIGKPGGMSLKTICSMDDAKLDSLRRAIQLDMAEDGGTQAYCQATLRTIDGVLAARQKAAS